MELVKTHNIKTRKAALVVLQQVLQVLQVIQQLTAPPLPPGKDAGENIRHQPCHKRFRGPFIHIEGRETPASPRHLPNLHAGDLSRGR